MIIRTYVKTQLFYKCSKASENNGRTSPGGEQVNMQRMRNLDSQWGNKWKLAAQRRVAVLICQKITEWQKGLCTGVLLSEHEFSLREQTCVYSIHLKQRKR